LNGCSPRSVLGRFLQGINSIQSKLTIRNCSRYVEEGASAQEVWGRTKCFRHGSNRVGFNAQALVILPSSLKSTRKGLLYGGERTLPPQFFQVACHLGCDLIKLFAAISACRAASKRRWCEAKGSFLRKTCIHVISVEKLAGGVCSVPVSVRESIS